MVSQTTNLGTSTASTNQLAERPTGKQWSRLHQMEYDSHANRKGLLTKARLQGFIDRLALESFGKTPAPEPQIAKPSEVMQEVLLKINQSCPDSLADLVHLLSPYANITSAMLEPAPYEALSKRYDRFIEKPTQDKIAQAISWVKVRDRKVHIIGDTWEKGTEYDDRAAKENLYRLTSEMFAEEMQAREVLRSGTLATAQSIAMCWQGHLMQEYRDVHAFRYGLISMEDIFRLQFSIVNALKVAVALTVCQPDPKLAKRALQFVDWQLGGNPIVRYEDGVAHLWAAPSWR